MTTEFATDSAADGLVEAQFRVDLVQILNWGGYNGLHPMPVGKRGTAILGPTGMGKSTILDAMAAVIMPNPQEFNRAARDDGGKRSERTVYSYARGKIDDRKEGSTRSTTTHYLRPVGSPGFPSGVAVTWSSDLGETITAARIAWVASDASTQDEVNNTTVYMMVAGNFSLERLSEAKPVNGAKSPLSESALKAIVNASRDLVTSSQPTLRAELCSKLGIGDSAESQDLALKLLRRAQASKGIFSINDLFKEFVLTKPLALKRWETTLKAYREASGLYDVFEDTRKRLEILKNVPEQAERYKAAIENATAKRDLYLPQPDGAPTRLEVWHARKVKDWVAAAIEQNRITRASAEEKRAAAQRQSQQADLAWKSAADRIVALGGDQKALLTNKLENAQEEHKRVDRARRDFEAKLQSVRLDIPFTAEEMGILKEIASQQRAELEALTAEGKERSQELGSDVITLKGKRDGLRRELESLGNRPTSNVPEHADTRRRRIAHGVGIPAESLRYIGELIEVDAAHRGWTKAINRVLGSAATDLLASETDFSTVRRYVDENDMRGLVRVVPASVDHPPTATPIDGTVPAMLRFDTTSPYYGWLLDDLTKAHSMLCVESADDLDRPRPPGVSGAVTRAGLRTGSRRRVIKDDRPELDSWLGLDNSARRAKLQNDMAGIERSLDSARSAYDKHDQDTTLRRQEIQTLEDLAKVEWETIDPAPHDATIARLTAELATVDQPEVDQLRKEMNKQIDLKSAAESKRKTQQDAIEELDYQWGQLTSEVEDKVKDILEEETPLSSEELGYLSQTPFSAPTAWNDVARSRSEALRALKDQADRHTTEAGNAEQLLIGIFQRYRDNDETAEIDANISSLTAVQAIHQTLVEDDLPRAKKNWLAKAGKSMTESLRALLSQIAEDSKTIHRGVRPINQVLKRIEFREGSTLEIEVHDHENGDLRDFKKTLTKHTRNTLGALAPDDETIERNFLALRKDLARLDEKTKAGDAWRQRVLDAREHVQFSAVETPPDGPQVVYEGASGLSGGEGQGLIAFVLGAALRYRLGSGTDQLPTYAPIVLDEGFVKADSEYTGRALGALQGLGFQLIIGAPRDKVNAFEEYVDTVAYINRDPGKKKTVRIYPLTIEEAVLLEQHGIEPGRATS